ncbi:helix-turn-helix domain-containing protein [Desulfitobacterium metallireducens]|uniref:HTH cro/C1-type domain-containing protein n=1 Tax=Desulfitobacterium metallireducens DSM 15288 TaxID=871968 RepID=W0EFW1_9FIRM|nr:helix-turn-helix domain-containing protein [Desulfitobacterium metallireducens]AHF08403.1 hypothetical protein DESME_02000 [Desulfitobacterium metallireducens DSM 15288]
MRITPLKQKLIDNSLTISSLAKSCNISSSYLSLIVNGHRTNIDEEIIRLLSENLNIQPNDFKTFLIPHGLKRTESQEAQKQGLLWLNNLLDALDVDNKREIRYYTDLLYTISSSVLLAKRYVEWYEGWQLALENQFEDALKLFEQAKQLQPSLSVEKRFKAKVMGSIGGALVAKGNYKEAMKSFRSSLFLWDSGKQVAIVYLNMGTLFRRTHQYKRASEMYEKAIEYGPNHVKINAFSSLAQVALDKNDLHKARQCVLRGYWTAKSEIKPRDKDVLYCNIGLYFSLLGKTKRSKYWLGKSLRINLETKNRRTKQFALAELVNVYLLEDNISQADNLLASIHNELSENNDSLALASSFCIIAKRHLKTKELNKSFLILTRCYDILSKLPPSYEQITCCSLLKKYYQIIKEPYLAEFYDNEIKYMKSKIR